MMEKRTDITFLGALLAAIMALLGLAACAAPTAPPAEQVTITGYLYADGTPMDDAVLVVELEEDQCLHSVVMPNGRFNFDVPVGAQVRLIFMKPGFHTKEVTVDTKNAMCSERARRINDKVKFDVVLERSEEHPCMTYYGPVGTIHFVRGSGLMRIWHDGRMVEVADANCSKP